MENTNSNSNSNKPITETWKKRFEMIEEEGIFVYAGSEKYNDISIVSVYIIHSIHPEYYKSANSLIQYKKELCFPAKFHESVLDICRHRAYLLRQYEESLIKVYELNKMIAGNK